MTERILFFSPYAKWAYHTALECTWAHGLALRGESLKFVLCDAQFPVCDVFRAGVNPRDGMSCNSCQRDVADQFHALRVNYEWLGRYVPPEVPRIAEEFARDVATASLLQAHWKGLPVAAWTASSAGFHYRSSRLNVDDPVIEMLLRGHLKAAVIAAEGLRVLLDDFQPDTMVTLNGRFYPHWIAIELCKQRGIRFVTHERGLRKNTIRFTENSRMHELESNRERWSRWKDVPLQEDQVQHIQGVLQDRRDGKGYSWMCFSPPPQAREEVCRKLDLDDRPIVGVFGSSEDETAAFPDRTAGAFPDSRQFLPAVLDYARRRPEYQFVIRVHPNVNSLGTNHQQLEHARTMRESAPENVRVVMPKDPVSSYTLADLSCAGIVYATTLGLEMAVTGKPVVAVAQGTYSHTGCTTQVERPEDFEQALDHALGAPPSRETARLALRWAYHYFDQFAIPFDLVREEPQHHAELRYSTAAEIMPGKDPTLDRVCEFLRGREDILPSPDLGAFSLGCDAEDRFLDQFLMAGSC